MIRHCIEELYTWKKRPNRKPLILQGARQVGKTWLMLHFAQEAFEDFIYINFDNNEQLKNLFAPDYSMERIGYEIYLATGKRPSPGTLLLLDEIQEATRGVSALKYFCELRPEWPVIAAGSLLGISTQGRDSFPVGKVDFMTLYPMSFFEFLEAVGLARFVEVLKARRWEMVKPIERQLQELLRQYYYVGGMPEVVQAFVDTKDVQEVRRLQLGILDAYDRDFSKHAPIAEVPRLRMIWRSIGGQLAKENKKYIYGFVKEGARAKDFELSLEWLRDAGLINKVNRSKKGQIPLAAYEDFSAFKVFMLDVGLLGAMVGVPHTALLGGNALFTDYKGALTEQYVHQQLRLAAIEGIHYWSADNSRGEIDFLVQQEGKVIPIEVKAEENLQSKSLRAFVQANSGLHGVRLSMSPYREQDWMTNYPLYSLNAILPRK